MVIQLFPPFFRQQQRGSYLCTSTTSGVSAPQPSLKRLFRTGSSSLLAMLLVLCTLLEVGKSWTRRDHPACAPDLSTLTPLSLSRAFLRSVSRGRAPGERRAPRYICTTGIEPKSHFSLNFAKARFETTLTRLTVWGSRAHVVQPLNADDREGENEKILILVDSEGVSYLVTRLRQSLEKVILYFPWPTVLTSLGHRVRCSLEKPAQPAKSRKNSSPCSIS